MRLKFLSAIASLLIFSITIESCLGDNDPVDVPVDVTIWEFQLDTIYGVDYKFTIDQIKGEIYNLDSVPHSADTIINKVLVRKINAPYAYPTSGDTLFVAGRDSFNFLNGPLRLKMLSASDFVTSKEYTISVRIHKQDPDSIIWNRLADRFTTSPVQQQKAVEFGDRTFIYTSNTDVSHSLTRDGRQWSQSTVTGLPADLKLSSIINYKDELYAHSLDGKVFSSEDGLIWSESPLSGNVKALIATLPEGIAGVIEEGATSRFALTNPEATTWTLGSITPDGFPLEDISSASYVTRTGTILRTVCVGKSAANSRQTIVWFTEDGMNWADIATSSRYSLPAMDQPSIIYYNDMLCAYGGDFSTFYTSIDGGLVWNTIDRKFVFPNEFAKRGDYSSFVDNKNFIWIVWTGQTGSYTNQVWNGRLNKLGFGVQ